MPKNINLDVFSIILSFLWDRKSLFSIVNAVPVTHSLFWPTVHRILDFPVFLCTDDDQPAFHDSEKLLDTLLGEEDGEPVHAALKTLRDSLKHVVIHGSDDGRWPVFDSENESETAPKIFSLLQTGKRLRSINFENQLLPTSDFWGFLPKELDSLVGDCLLLSDCGVEDWKWTWEGLVDLVDNLSPRLSYLRLEKISLETWKIIEQCKKLSMFNDLTHIHLDLMEGAWDIQDPLWPEGHEEYPFKEDIGLPALKDVKIRLIDYLLVQENPGIMGFTRWENVEDLSITVEMCDEGYYAIYQHNIIIFNFLPSTQFDSLRVLELSDTRRWKKNWEWYNGGPIPESFENARPQLRNRSDDSQLQRARCYWGFVPLFLNGIRTGDLSNLSHLWVNEHILCMPKSEGRPGVESDLYTVQELWERSNDLQENQKKKEWIAILRAVFERLSSLRVGFGPMRASELALILGCCSRDRLLQFGFQYLWAAKDRCGVIPSSVLIALSQFPRLVDFHVLHPRPGTQETYFLPSPSKNGATIQDVVAIFKANPKLSYVGIANAVWERNCLPHSGKLESVTLAWDMYSDPRGLAVDSVPRFFQIPRVDTYMKGFCMRASPVEETRCMRDLAVRLQKCPSN